MLKYLRVPVVQSNPRSRSSSYSLLNAVRGGRFYSEEVRGTFLDKSEVTDRIITVVKNFQKVDPSKVRSFFFFRLFEQILCFILFVPRNYKLID